MSHPYTVGLICARGGSKGVPRKNLRALGGRPLIGWAIDTARRCRSLDRVVVSTEDAEIAEVARSLGAEIPFLRPAELAQDDSPELLTWQHCIQALMEQDGRAPEVLVSIPATTPLRAVEDVETCIATLHDYGADLCITVKPAERNPYFNLVRIEDGWATKLLETTKPIFRRQDAPAVFDIAGSAYAALAEYVLRTRGIFDGRVRAALVPAERSVDIDTELDLAFVEFLLKEERRRT